MPEERARLPRKPAYRSWVPYQIERRKDECIKKQGGKKMQERLSLAQEQEGVAPEQIIVPGVWVLRAGGLVPDARLGYIVAFQPNIPGPSAPVRLLPVGKVLLIEEAHPFQCLPPDEHAGAVGVVPLRHVLVLAAVLLAPAGLPGGPSPGVYPADGRADDGGVIVEVYLGAQDRRVRQSLGCPDELFEEGWLDHHVVVQQQHIVGIRRQRVPNSQIATAREAQVVFTDDELRSVTESLLQNTSIVPGGAVIYNDGLVAGVRYAAHGLQALAGVGNAIPVDDDDGDAGPIFHRCRPARPAEATGLAFWARIDERLIRWSHPPTINHLLVPDKTASALPHLTAAPHTMLGGRRSHQRGTKGLFKRGYSFAPVHSFAGWAGLRDAIISRSSDHSTDITHRGPWQRLLWRTASL